MLIDPHSTVVETIARLERALAAHDVDAAVAGFTPSGALFGSGVGEQAHGTRELRRWLRDLVERDLAPRWSVDETYARVSGDEIWFVADARLDVDDERGGRTGHRFRMSGTLRGGRGYYRFELFNGFEPLSRPDLRLVG